MISKEEKQEIGKYLANQPGVDMAYLFGSQSTGRANSLSDIDIAVLFNQNLDSNQRFNEKLRIAGDLGLILKTNNVEVVDLNSAGVALRFSAIENRDILFVRNDLARSLFEADTMSRYQDYKYYLSMNTQNSLASISRMAV